MTISKNAGKVQTVLGLVDPEDLGITLPHEHLISDPTGGGAHFEEPEGERERILAHQPVRLDNLSWVRFNPRSNLDNRLLDEALAIKELTEFKALGGRTAIEQTNVSVGRNPEALVRVSKETGLNIIMGSGYFATAPRTRKLVEAKSAETIAAEIVRDIELGVADTGIKSGIVGELACTHPLKESEAKLLRAGGMAQRQTGAALWLHPGLDERSPFEELEVLKKAGADLSRVVVCHMDLCHYTLESRLRLLDAGCYLEYDVFGREGYWPPAHSVLAEGRLPEMPNDTARIREIRELIGLGYAGRLLVSHDIAQKIAMVSYGGWGYGHILRNVAPLMKVYGITDAQIATLLAENPKRLLPFA
ncbi:MAG: hypothetical protein HYY32_02160 [Chloroflexi bacterium]|nr:hypothetical protein [Chloroflexota bacterium]